jgi:hypothetical protein
MQSGFSKHARGLDGVERAGFKSPARQFADPLGGADGAEDAPARGPAPQREGLSTKSHSEAKQCRHYGPFPTLPVFNT